MKVEHLDIGGARQSCKNCVPRWVNLLREVKTFLHHAFVGCSWTCPVARHPLPSEFSFLRCHWKLYFSSIQIRETFLTDTCFICNAGHANLMRCVLFFCNFPVNMIDDSLSYFERLPLMNPCAPSLAGGDDERKTRLRAPERASSHSCGGGASGRDH